MIIKEGVTLAGIDFKMRKVLIAADKIWKENHQELVITEARGGTHSAGSLHYYGLALDMRTRYFDAMTKTNVAMLLREELGPDYDVIMHSSHCHVEYDAK